MKFERTRLYSDSITAAEESFGDVRSHEPLSRHGAQSNNVFFSPETESAMSGVDGGCEAHGLRLPTQISSEVPSPLSPVPEAINFLPITVRIDASQPGSVEFHGVRMLVHLSGDDALGNSGASCFQGVDLVSENSAGFPVPESAGAAGVDADEGRCPRQCRLERELWRNELKHGADMGACLDSDRHVRLTRLIDLG